MTEKSRTREGLFATLSAEVRLWQADQELFDATVADLADLNRTDWRILDVLGTRGPMTPGQLADVANITTGGVTWALDRLEAGGLVHRIRDEHDRRKIRVELTEEVAQRALPVYGPLMEDINRLLAGFDDDQLEAVIAFVRGSREILATHTARLRASGRGESPRSAQASGLRRSGQ
jgi:DNA-binding MarR family transcriptional regulator